MNVTFGVQINNTKTSMVLRVGGCTLLGVGAFLSMELGCLFVEIQKVASTYLHNLFYTEEEF
jgi:hypothetical protein